MKYRPEIDGLRAVAVIPVIFFHAGFNQFSGGFVGVDVFFVISGYLITSIILEDIEEKRFNVLDFYERRARRILPALLLVMLCCIPFAITWMSSAELRNFSRGLIAVSLFASNVLLWRQGGYFDVATEENPLIHTWSLAVEEQFYVIFPFFLMTVWRFGRRGAFWTIVTLGVASLALAEWGHRVAPSANFYLAPTRAWELLAGSIAAFIVRERGVVANNALSFLGLGAIALSVILFDSSTPFPSVYALLPVGGALLVVLFVGEGTIAARLLSLRLCVGVGLISYSAYLWHQPLFAFARLHSAREPSHALMLALSAAAIVLAILSWRFVEQPFRDRRRFGRRAIFAGTVVGCVGLASFGLLGELRDGRLTPYNAPSPNVEWASFGDKLEKQGEVCDTALRLDGYEALRGCYFGDRHAERVVVLYGDSHAQMLAYSLAERFQERNIRGAYLTIDGCETVPFFRRNRSLIVTDCAQRFDELLGFIQETNADIVLSSRWTFKLYPIEGVVEDLTFRNADGYVETDITYREYDVWTGNRFRRDAETKTLYMGRFLDMIASAARQVYLIYPIPETAIDIEKANRLHFLRNGSTIDRLSFLYSDYKERNSFIINFFDNLSIDNIVPIRAQALLCDSFIEGQCAVQLDGVPLYYDDDHLSKVGADMIVEEILGRSDWPH